MDVKTVHTFGDSHAGAVWMKIKQKDIKIKVHHLGAKLMFSFGRDKLDMLDIAKHKVSKGDIVCFCFGEIDCRCHVNKHAKDGYEKIIDSLVGEYEKAIALNVLRYHNITTCIYNVVPPVRKEGMWEHPSFPFLGTDEERKQYVFYMNKKLKEACDRRNWVFFDIFDHFRDEEGFMRKDMSDGNVHIIDPKPLIDFIRKKL